MFHNRITLCVCVCVCAQLNENENQIDQILKEVAVQKSVLFCCVCYPLHYILTFDLQTGRKQDAV